MAETTWFERKGGALQLRCANLGVFVVYALSRAGPSSRLTHDSYSGVLWKSCRNLADQYLSAVETLSGRLGSYVYYVG